MVGQAILGEYHGFRGDPGGSERALLRPAGSLDRMTLQALGEGLWVVDGPAAVDLLVVPYPTRMCVVRLDDGDLWVTSPVTLPYESLGEVVALGPVAHLLAPTPRHHWRLETWHRLFPDAALWSCALGPATLGRRALPATRLADLPPPQWSGQIDQVRYGGVGFEEFTFLHRASGTLLVEDMLQEHPLRRRPLVDALVRIGGIGPGGGVPRDIRALARPESARRWAEQVLSWDFDTLVMAHGPVITSGAKQWVARAIDWMLS